MAEKFLNTLLSNYLLNANNKIEICKSLAEILDNLNYFHPFREGMVVLNEKLSVLSFDERL